MFTSRSKRRAMTLVELTAGMAIMTVLSTALMSAMLIASHAIPERKPAEERAVATADALEQLASDLTFATAITTLTDREIVFTVADRGDAPAGAETIRYVWYGTPGGALIRQYNGGAADAVVDRVTSFVLTPRPAMKPITQAPRVLMVVADEVSQTSGDRDRVALLTAWGFPFQLMADDRAASDILAAVPSTDVIYVSGDVGNVGNFALPDARVGMVVETCSANAALSLSSTCVSTTNTGMVVVDNQHEILSGYATGLNLSLTNNSQPFATASGPAPGTRCLGESTSGADVLFVLDLDGQLTTGGFAKARRVRMPWGLSYATPVAFSQLSPNGKTILRRSLAWASATPVVAGVKISVQPDDPGAAVVETEVSILNQPRDPRP